MLSTARLGQDCGPEHISTAEGSCMEVQQGMDAKAGDLEAPA